MLPRLSLKGVYCLSIAGVICVASPVCANNSQSGSAKTKVAQIMPELMPPLVPGAAAPSNAQLQLSDALNETLGRSPRAASVRYQLGIAKAAVPTALTFPNPSLLVYNGFKAEQTYQVGASIPVEAPWKVFFRLATAKQQIKQADLEILRELWELRFTVKRAYLEVVVAQEMATALTELAELTRSLQIAAQKRFGAGDVAELDVLRAQQALSQAEMEKAQGQGQIILAKRRLRLLLGRDFEAEVEVPRLGPIKLRAERTELLPDLDQPMPPLKQFVVQAEQNRPDLKVLLQSIRTNQASLRSTYANIWPNTQLNVGHSITGNPPDGPKLHGYFVGITQELPLFNFQQGDIARYRATVSQLKREYDARKNVASEEVAVAYERVLIARNRISAYQDHLLDQAEEVARKARRAYEVGQADIISAVLAQQENVRVKRSYYEAVRDYQQSITELEQAVGTPI
jgi:outer membrane protein, heavy metal efflux system